MQPTTFGVSPGRTTGAAPNLAAMPSSVLALPQNFPVIFDAEQEQRLTARVAQFDFANLAASQIVTLGMEAETALGRSLDAFLARIDKQDAPQMFKLVVQLKEAVDKENLPDVAAQVLNAQPTLVERVVGIFSRKALNRAVNRAYDEAGRVASGKSKKLSDVVTNMEVQLRAEMGKLSVELSQLDNVKAQYRQSFLAFAEETAFLHGALNKTQSETAQFLASNPDALLLADWQDKLQALESRALAVEGTLTKLPADQLVIRQLQNAGLATMQELTTTMASRFSSIKMTLLTIHGARMVQDVQRLGQQGVELDENLTKVRSMLMHDVVGTAAHAPGANREAQAKQLQGIVADTKSLYELSESARVSNQEKFAQARVALAQSREEMLSLGKKMNPSAAYSQS